MKIAKDYFCGAHAQFNYTLFLVDHLAFDSVLLTKSSCSVARGHSGVWRMNFGDDDVPQQQSSGDMMTSLFLGVSRCRL
ncbi:hypothetical protein SAMN05444398_1336 [Roseovarius pacificus]|uniref:Uncharacterized protein n=1 Tax=Roseovarius pacificus TaxID=337701 RepID=A0A1M7KP09_9RHOB|nr:hypothetical protein GCM10011315_42800 [Roseovarius pacificus]SHM67176.1 hypothetical protein SAMN05444398_1336 [Roseovarius pacificus]